MSPAEFDLIYHRYSREVWAMAYARRMDADLALDVMQEAFLRLWKAAADHEPVRHPRAWLLRVARNLAGDFAKSSFRKHGTQAAEIMANLSEPENDPVQQMARQERCDSVRSELGRLPEADREVLTLRYALGYDVPRIAELLSTSNAAVHMRLSRARQKLAERLSAAGVIEST